MGVLGLTMRLEIYFNERAVKELEGTEKPSSEVSVNVMPKEQKEIDGLGPTGIFREAHKLWSTHFKFFSLIQLSLMLPLAILVVACQWWWLGTTLPHDSPRHPRTGDSGELILTFSGTDRGVDIVSILLMLITTSMSASYVSIVSFPWLLVLVLKAIVVAIAYEAAVGLFSSAILCAVGLHYTGQSVSFENVLRVSVPRLWMRLTFTNIYYSLLWYAMYTVGIGGFLVLGLNKASDQYMTLEVKASVLLVMYAGLYLDMVFMLAGNVSVLEKDYGWAAVRRSLKLLKGRLTTAVLFQLLWLFPAFILLALHNMFGAHIFSGGGFRGNFDVILFILATLYICYLTYIWLLKALCAGIQYSTFKAYHNEDIRESMDTLGIVNSRYERMENTIHNSQC